MTEWTCPSSPTCLPPIPIPTALLLDEFLSLLPPLPTPIGVFSAGGVAEVVLADLDRGLLIGYAPQMLMQPAARRRVPAARPERRRLRRLAADREGLLPVVEPDAAAPARDRGRAPARPPPHEARPAQRRGRCGGAALAGAARRRALPRAHRRHLRGRRRVRDRAPARGRRPGDALDLHRRPPDHARGAGDAGRADVVRPLPDRLRGRRDRRARPRRRSPRSPTPPRATATPTSAIPS